MTNDNNSYDNLVSIIMPAYNSEKFIVEAIQSVVNQTYINWELLIVDDCSSDNTVNRVLDNFGNDNRIKLIRLHENSGAAIARNTAIKEAKGQYLAFLDSDDLWKTQKLTKQIQFMQENNYLFTCTSYSKIDEEGTISESEVVPHEVNDYNDVLKNSPGNSTVIYNASVLGKFYSPDIRRRNDFVMWLQVIKKAQNLYGIQKTYTYYRLRDDSLSRKKFKLVKYQWLVYRKHEKLNVIKSAYLLIIKIFDVIKEK